MMMMGEVFSDDGSALVAREAKDTGSYCLSALRLEDNDGGDDDSRLSLVVQLDAAIWGSVCSMCDASLTDRWTDETGTTANEERDEENVVVTQTATHFS